MVGQETKKQVFISYSRKDMVYTRQLAADLEKAGYSVWWDISDLRGGDDWIRFIPSAINASHYFVVLLSPNSIASEWVTKEYSYALRLRKKVIPAMIKPCDVPFALNTINYVDFVNEAYNVALNKLLLALDGFAQAVVRTRGLKKASIKLSPIVTRKLFLAIGTAILLLALLLYSLPIIVPPYLTPSGQFTPTQPNSVPLTSTPIPPEIPMTQLTPVVLTWTYIGSHIVLDPDGKYWEKYQGDISVPGLYLRLKDITSFGEAPGDFLELKADGTFDLEEARNRVNGTWQMVEENKIILNFP